MTAARIAPLFAAAALLCATAASASDPAAPRDDKARDTLDTYLGGKVAGAPRQCISMRGTAAVEVDDATLLYPVSSNLVYRNDLQGPCPGLHRKDNIKVFAYRTSNVRLCAGDQFYLVDPYTGATGPFCRLGVFTPYEAAPQPAD